MSKQDVEDRLRSTVFEIHVFFSEVDQHYVVEVLNLNYKVYAKQFRRALDAAGQMIELKLEKEIANDLG